MDLIENSSHELHISNVGYMRKMNKDYAAYVATTTNRNSVLSTNYNIPIKDKQDSDKE